MSTQQGLCLSLLLAAGLLSACRSQTAGPAPLPADPAVRTGRLPNGFTYYLRRNGEPAKRVLLYLVNNVGSVLEDDDQQGLAHFMEHMNFNGTKHFPGNTLVDYLQKAGVRFGADLNAHTSYDETVYELPLPTNDSAMVPAGLRIMRDWAQEATLDSLEIEKERGVVLEEERLGKGAADRMSRQYLPTVFNGSRYASRQPIGVDSILRHFKPETIRRFHHDWYRPDLQALIVVGDIDVDAVERQVKEQFATLVNPPAERKWTQYAVPLERRTTFQVVTDKEQPVTSIQVMYKHPISPLRTTGDLRALIERALLSRMLNARRFAELSPLPDPAFLNVGMGIESFHAGMAMFTFSVTAKAGRMDSAFSQGWAVLQRIRRYGFTQGELERAKVSLLSNEQQVYDERDKTPSAEFVHDYLENFLHGQAYISIPWEYHFEKDVLPAIHVEDINNLALSWLGGTDEDILVLAPEQDKDKLPGQTQIAAWTRAVENSPMTAYKDGGSGASLLASLPTGGKIVKTETDPALHTTTLTLGNGIRVILKPTDFKNDEILFEGFRPGGTSLYNDADYPNAATAAGYIGGFGVGNFTPVQLSQLMSGRQVSTSAFIASREEGMSGRSSGKDLETALQLLYLQATAPRKDTQLFRTYLENSREALPNRYISPANVFRDTMSYFLGGYSFRSSPPSLKKLDRLSLDRMYAIYKERLGDASGSTFVFVGSFDVDSISPLLARYLGALPAIEKPTAARNLSNPIPAGRWEKKVYKGREDKATVNMIISGPKDDTPLDDMLLKALGQILQMKLIDHIREQESQVYSPQVKMSTEKYPHSQFALEIGFGCAPANAEHVMDLVRGDIAGLRSAGITDEYVEKYKAAYSKTLEVAKTSNDFWLAWLIKSVQDKEDPDAILEREKLQEQVTPAALRAAADKYFTGNNEIRFVLLPEKTS